MKEKTGTWRKAFRAAFPLTLLICAGFLFLGLAYGVYMNSKGFCLANGHEHDNFCGLYGICYHLPFGFGF